MALASSPYGTKPGNLSKPVPLADDHADDFFAGMSEVGKVPAALAADAPALAQPSAEEIVSQASEAALQVPRGESAPDADAFFSGLSGGDGASADEDYSPSFGQQAGELGIRAKASFAMSDKERLQVLTDEYGKGKVRKRGDNWEVKRPGEKNWTPFDAKGFDLGDVADFARPALEGAVTVPFELAGLEAGPVGVAAGRAAGGALATHLADQFADHVLGITQDGGRNKLLEAGVAGTLNAALGGASDKVFNYAATKIAAKQAARSPWEIMTEANRSLLTATEDLAQTGVVKYVPGGDIVMFPHQVDPTNPQVLRAFREHADLPLVQKRLNQQAENAGDSLVTYLKTAADVTKAGDQPIEKLAERAASVVQGVKSREGSEIGRWMKVAQEAHGDTRIALPTAVQDMASELQANLGFVIKSGAEGQGAKLVLQDPRELIGSLGIQTPSEIRFYQGRIEDFINKVRRGGLSLEEYSKAITLLEPVVDKAESAAARGANGNMFRLTSMLQSEMRQARRTAIESGLPDEAAKAAFNESMDRFGQLMQARGDMRKVLGDDLTNKAFLRRIINTNDTTALQAAKGLFEKEAPEVWHAIKSNYVDQLIAKATDAGSRTGFNVTKLQTELLDPGTREVRRLIFDKGDEQIMKNLFRYVQRIEDTDLNAISKDKARQLATGLIDIASAKPWLITRGFMYLGGMLKNREGDFMKILTQDGFNRMLKRYPPAKQAAVRGALGQWVDKFRQGQTAGALKKGAAGTATQGARTLRMDTAERLNQLVAPESAPVSGQE